LLERCFFGQKLRAFLTDGMATVEVQHPCTALDHEGVDLGVVIGMKGEDSPQDVAKDHVDGYALAFDMVATEPQAVAKVDKENECL
jgi:2-keto-4-pentenoate hydratase/2-oxohepta-3-ene-1,7-dioic acid hydratase in catechol pathway